jgi:hypothetical protein
MLKHNSYFDGRVQSVGFERNGRRHTIGAVAPGEFHFDLDGPERMTVISGELAVRISGTQAWRTYPTGTSFELPRKCGVDFRAEAPAAYLCEYL